MCNKMSSGEYSEQEHYEEYEKHEEEEYGDFLNLIIKERKDEPGFNIEEIIKKVEDNNDIDYIDFKELLPGMIYITHTDINNVVHYGNECTMDQVDLYRYDNQYISVHYVNHMGLDDINVTKISTAYNNVIDFFNTAVTVYEDIDPEKYINSIF